VEFAIGSVEGDFEIAVDGAGSQLCAGQTIHVPRGAIRSGADVGQQLSRCIGPPWRSSLRWRCPLAFPATRQGTTRWPGWT
jgi:hypothetical protein